MFWQCYAVKDEKTGIFHTPFFVNHVAQAIRNFQINVNRPDSMLNIYPKEYGLYLLFHWDDESGISKFTASGVPELTKKAVELITEPPPKKEDDNARTT